MRQTQPREEQVCRESQDCGPGAQASRRPEDTVLVFYGHCEKLPQTKWLKTTKMYFLIVLEARSPKSVLRGQDQGVSRAVSSLGAFGENPSPASPAPGGSCHSLARGFITFISATWSHCLLLFCLSNLPAHPSWKVTRDYI